MRWRTALAVGLVVGVAGGGGCGSSGNGVAGPPGTSGGSSGAGASGGSDSGIVIDGSTSDVQSLSIVPASATIDVTNGTSAPVTFKLMAHYQDGSTAQVSGSWSFSALDVATVSGAGVVTADGTKGGIGKLSAQADSLGASASVTVKLHFTDNSANLSSGDQSKFNTPDATPSGTLLYPYDQTVFARGILPPELMWNGGNAGDSYRVAITDQYVDLAAYVTADPPSRWLMAQSWWDALTESNTGGPVSVKVERLDATGAHAAMGETWTIAPGSLRGTIYYWAVNLGQIVKITPGANAPVAAFDPGPYDQLGTPAPSNYNNQSPPWQDTGSGSRCVACHTVSKDGSTIAAVFSADGTYGGSRGPWGSVNSTSETIQALGDYTAEVRFLALTPDGQYVVSNSDGFTMALSNAQNGTPIASALDSLGQNAADPQFSPDGTLLAFAGNVVGSYPVEFTSSDLEVSSANMTAAPYFGAPQTIVAGGGQAIAFPSFTPDSAWIVYQRGDYSRASYGTGLTGHDDLYMADVAKTAGEVKLAQADGVGVLAAKDAQRSYEPRVNPVSVGGYYWVVFVSPRDYGNVMVSTTDSTTENHKQLWVAAIDANPTPGKDPSHPAFWLPGQDETSINMDAYWTLAACEQQGKSCSAGYECCSGFCRAQGDGGYACVPPPSNQCAQIGEACKTAQDCCTGAQPVACVGGFCALKGPA
jgi:Tol biopolymer transport system component